MRKWGFYSADKTSFIIELLKNGCEVNVLSRPRRFEKRSIRESALTSISSTG